MSERSVVERFGVLPNLFCAGSDGLWSIACSAYLDNPLPRLLKERIAVHLSRFCEARYCIARHVGFLVGLGVPAGGVVHTSEEVLALLGRRPTTSVKLDWALRRLESRSPDDTLPAPGTPAEADLFDALTRIFLVPLHSTRARSAVQRSYGPSQFEHFMALLTYLHAAHYWTETHPQLQIEPDVHAHLERHPLLRDLVLDPGDSLHARILSASGVAQEERNAQTPSQTQWWLGAQREAFQAAMNDAPLATSLGILVSAIQELSDHTEQCAFYITSDAGETLLPVAGIPAPSSDVLCWSFPIETSKGLLVGSFAMYFKQPRQAQARDVELAAAVTQTAAIIISRRRENEERMQSEERLRALMAGIPQLVWRAVENGHWTWSSPQWTDLTGFSVQMSTGTGWLQALHPDDRDPAMSSWSQAVRDGVLEIEMRIRHATTGEYRWFQTRATPVRNEAGVIIEWLGTSTDIHEQRQLQGRQQLLVGELQHRTRNLIAVVRSMADKSARLSHDIGDFRARFHDRLEALARVQGLLSGLHEPDRVSFDELLRSELSALDVDFARIALDGPAGIRLRTSTVQTLALALHELATNALKYGALAQAAARLSVSWRFEPGVEPRLHIDWHELDVEMPRAADTTPRRGQGRELIEVALPYQLDAPVDYELTPTGARCRISICVAQEQGRLKKLS